MKFHVDLKLLYVVKMMINISRATVILSCVLLCLILLSSVNSLAYTRLNHFKLRSSSSCSVSERQFSVSTVYLSIRLSHCTIFIFNKLLIHYFNSHPNMIRNVVIPFLLHARWNHTSSLIYTYIYLLRISVVACSDPKVLWRHYTCH